METLQESLNKLENNLRLDLLKYLNKTTKYYIDNTTLKPVDSKQAFSLEWGEPAIGKSATMFIEKAIKDWSKDNNIKGL